MKGFVACMLASVPRVQARGLVRPLHLFISYDEETDCSGAHRLVEDMRESHLLPAMCVVGEPTGMQPVVAQKGRVAARVTVRGLAGHSSAPAKGVNAVQQAAAAIMYLVAEGNRHRSQGPFEEGFDPPYTSVHVGPMQGGEILNIIPDRAAFIMEWRNIPSVDPMVELERFRAFVQRELEPAMRAISPEAGFSVEFDNVLPPLSINQNHPLVEAALAASGWNNVGKVAYGTEGGIYQNAGIATLICGPGHIAQAHRPDEFIDEQQLTDCDNFIDRLVERVLV
jgi:acetylornithine deacetylase